MKTVLATLLIFATSVSLASACPAEGWSFYNKAKGPKAMVLSNGAVSYNPMCWILSGGRSKKEIEAAALAKCKAATGAGCHVLRSSDH